MTRPVLIVRPQPGADRTAERARRLALQPIVTPLFKIVARPWQMPEHSCDALLVTSANAVLYIDSRVDRSLPVYAIGPATAAALEGAGFTRVIAGEDGVEQAVAMAEAAAVGSLLHLAGEVRTPFDTRAIRIETRIVYAAEQCDAPPTFAQALAAGAVTLLHSARAARRFRELAGPGHRIAAISAAVLTAAGEDWSEATTADRPTDEALLAAAARLCQ